MPLLMKLRFSQHSLVRRMLVLVEVAATRVWCRLNLECDVIQQEWEN